MIELFQMGGVLFMSLLTLELVVLVFFAIKGLAKKVDTSKTVKSIGLLAAMTGILGQLIGLFSAFEYIEQMGSVSPGMLAGGLKVSTITTLYGLLTYIIAILLSLGIKFMNKRT